MPEFVFLNYYMQLAWAKMLLAICDWSNELSFAVLKTYYEPGERIKAGMKVNYLPKSLSAIIALRSRNELAKALGHAKKLIDPSMRPTPPTPPQELKQQAMAI